MPMFHIRIDFYYVPFPNSPCRNDETMRFSQLLEKLQPRITQRMLTKQLRQLEEDGLVTRKVYAQVPPKVEYSLTETGKSLMPILDQLCEWGYEHMGDRIEFKCE